MSEHKIRLRGGWELHGPSVQPRRVDLPLGEPPGLDGKVQFVRGFQRPPLDPARERLELAIGDATGLESILLNDQDLGYEPAGPGERRIPLDGPLPTRNRLTLVVDLGRAEFGPERPWGSVALVVVGLQ